MAMPGKRETGEIERRLRERADELRDDVRRELRNYDEQTYSRLTEGVPDPGDQSVADLLSDLNLADVTRDIGELRDIDVALQRLKEGSYGICVDCGREIDPARLEANPAAVRCIDDQRRYENRDRRKHYPSL